MSYKNRLNKLEQKLTVSQVQSEFPTVEWTPEESQLLYEAYCLVQKMKAGTKLSSQEEKKLKEVTNASGHLWVKVEEARKRGPISIH
jgi:hypothetical protein